MLQQLSRDLCSGVVSAGVLVACGSADALRPVVLTDPSVPVNIRDTGDPQMNALMASASMQQTWRPVCGSTTNVHDFALAVELSEESLRGEQVIMPNDGLRNQAGGFDIVFNVFGSPPAGALDALTLAESYIESRFTDTLSSPIEIDVSFQSLPSGVLGSASSSLISLSYAQTRAALQDDMDDDDEIQNWLPAGTSLPVRFNGASSTSSGAGTILVSHATFKAIMPDVRISGRSASITFTTNQGFNWDYDPTDGVSPGHLCFVSVAVHEVGHSLGFSSGADAGGGRVTTMDMFRFQRSANNPSSYAQFQSMSRLVDFNSPDDDHNTDLVIAEYRMSDGSPYQSSHFREQSSNIGIMDPALSSGMTFYPDFFGQSDLNVFDAIGYDRVESSSCTADFNNDQSVTVGDILDFLSAWSGNQTMSDLNNDGAYSVGDILDFLGLWSAGCSG